ncbi:MAG: hypothetical protein ACO1Q7_21060 [Gemmatimonas sp.]
MSPADTFTFDRTSGVVHGPSDQPHTVGKRATASWTVCEHLRDFLADGLSKGARIAYVTGPDAWSHIDLDVSLSAAPTGTVSTEGTAPKGLTFWTNTDTHYPLQSGLSCDTCRQTLSWPLAR